MRRALGGVAVVAVLAAGVVGLAAAGEDGRVVFGSTTVGADAGDDAVKVSMLFGSLRVVVPDDVRVRTSGTVIFGSVDCETACRGGTGEVVEVRSFGGFGSVEILTESEAAEDN